MGTDFGATARQRNGKIRILFVTPAGTPVMGWVGSENTDPPTPPPAGANARLIAHPPTHPGFFRDGLKVRAPHTLAIALARALRARAGSARLRLSPMGARRTRAPSGAGSSYALVDCAHSIRRALLLPHTDKERGGGRGNAPARGRRMHAPDMRGGGSKGQNHRAAKGRSSRARGCDQNVAVLLLHHVRELSDCCARRFFFSKRTSDATPSPPHPHPPSRTARPSAGPTNPPRFS